MEDWYKPIGLPSLNKEITHLLYLLSKPQMSVKPYRVNCIV